MPYEPKPREALLLWRLIAAETPDERQPMLKNTRPRFTKAQCAELVEAGYLSLETRPGRRGAFVALLDGAWAWAARSTDVAILKSRSSVGAEALQGLLRRVLPFLLDHEIPLHRLFRDHVAEQPTGTADPIGGSPSWGNGHPVAELIESTCLALGGGQRKTRVRLSALRRELASVERNVLDQALLGLSDDRKLVLYRDDNTAALSDEDHRAALMLGGAPRHLVYLE